MNKRDFLTLANLSLAELGALFSRARALKAARAARQVIGTLAGRTLLLLFEKSSTRTRVSFEAAVQQLGGSAITLPFQDSQLARGEPLEDTARVVSRYVDAVMFRTHGDDRLAAFARASRVPVINGLSDGGHPVQLLAESAHGDRAPRWTAGARRAPRPARGAAGKADRLDRRRRLQHGALLDRSGAALRLHLAARRPRGLPTPAALVSKLPNLPNSITGEILLCGAQDAATGADVITTDVWISMGQEKEAAARRASFDGYCVDAALMKLAKPGAIFLHCLPAHRGEEVTAEVLDGPQSAVLDEAERNRMHVQKALLELLVLGTLPA